MKKQKRVTTRRPQKKISRLRASAGEGQGSAGIAAGVAEILSADQEADYFASGRRRSGLVPKTGAGLPDEDQSGAAEVDVGREEDLGGVSRGKLGAELKKAFRLCRFIPDRSLPSWA